MDPFETQLESVSGPVAVVHSVPLTQHQAQRVKRRRNVDLVPANPDQGTLTLPRGLGYDLVIVLGPDTWDGMRLYALCDDLKRQGLPVVFGSMSRCLYHEHPGIRNTGVMLDGMFALAGLYAPSLRPRGSYVEFGVFDGRSFTLAYQTLNHVCTTFYGFDSFAGICGTRPEERTVFADGQYFANVETFKHNMRLVGADMSRVHAVQGPFDETLRQPAQSYGIEHISVCNIDSDVYEAALLALEFVTPRLVNGALILFDEYHHFGSDPDRGEQRAIREWLEKHPNCSLKPYRSYEAVGASFIFRRAQDKPR